MKVPIADVIIVDDGKVLLVQQRKTNAYGLWSFPGGHVENSETPEQAAYREVSEELGVQLVDAILHKVHLLEKPDVTLELNTFIGHIDGKITLKDDELLAYGWFSLGSLADMKDKLRAPVIYDQAKEVIEYTA